MNRKLNALAEQGCSIEAALNRIGGDEEFLLMCMKMTIDDPCFSQLGESINARNVKGAFDAAHSLKGICANTGLDPLTKPACEITEILRTGSLEGVKDMYESMMATHAQLCAIVA